MNKIKCALKIINFENGANEIFINFKGAVNKVEVVCVCFNNIKSKVCFLKDPNYKLN